MAWIVAASLGAATALLPALAGSATLPAIEAVNVGGIYGEEHRWSPAQVTLTAGGVVLLSNSTAVPHGVEWIGTQRPSCEEGPGKVPVGNTPAASGTHWSGSCTFTQPGSYTFYCTVHGAAMRGTITVLAPGVTTGTTGGAEPPPATSTTVSAPVTPPGLVASGVRLAGGQRGGFVHGLVTVSSAGVGGRLEVDLLMRRSLLTRSASRSALVRVGRLIRPSLAAGKLAFSVSLDQRARSILRRRGRLALSVRVVLRGVQGQTMTVTRSLVEHR